MRTFVDHEDVVFTRAPLVGVVCQVRFQPILALLTKSGVIGVQEALRVGYPKFSRHDEREIAVGPQAVQVADKVPVWRFVDDTERWRVSLAVDFFSLDTERYSDFGEFLERLRFVIIALRRTLRPSRSVRVGLRYVNHFSYEGLSSASEWKSLLRPEVVGMVGTDLNLEESQTVSGLSEGDDKLVIRSGTVHDEPLKFLLDMDCFTERELEIAPDGDLVDLVASYSESLTSLFHWAIQSDLREYLGPHPRGAAT